MKKTRKSGVLTSWDKDTYYLGYGDSSLEGPFFYWPQASPASFHDPAPESRSALK
jgi:hypothetical protein